MFILANCPSFIGFYYKYLWRPKPNSLEAVLDDFSNGHDNIFCIQVGSNDGFQHDPLCKFIKRDGWRGLLLEPQPSAFKNLKYIYQKDSVTPINRALDQEDKQRKLFRVAFSNARWATGLSSFNRSQLVAMVESGHIARQCNKYGIQMPEAEDDIIGHDWIQCSSFETLMAENGVTKVDLIHIDTEGYDFEVLKLFPFGSFQPKVVIFEHTHLSGADRTAATEMLEKQGYQIRSFGADTVALLQ
ncbi:MAG: FkbM family methyltransferase [Cyanothece sp. SIO1E1]|nr:FkbM family methyltransferase [Cyanothece sp. SIO1E1]